MAYDFNSLRAIYAIKVSWISIDANVLFKGLLPQEIYNKHADFLYSNVKWHLEVRGVIFEFMTFTIMWDMTCTCICT